jgi:hypothetical protein
MRKGFSYLVFLFFVLIFLSAVMGFSPILQKYLAMQKMDSAKLQAHYYALSGVEYYKTKPNLPNNKISGLDLKNLENAAGFTYTLAKGGFKIVKNKDHIYFIGYVGQGLDKAMAEKVLVKIDTKIKIWE